VACARSLALLLAAIIAVAGCDSSSRPPSSGRQLFATACSACHSLSGHESPRRQGGDLLHLHIPREAMLDFVAEMPVRRPLTPTQERAVAAYVLGVEAQRG
jgi:mono/diheme cytochrome c family protein